MLGRCSGSMPRPVSMTVIAASLSTAKSQPELCQRRQSPAPRSTTDSQPPDKSDRCHVRRWQIRFFLKFNPDCRGEHLLASQYYGIFHRIFRSLRRISGKWGRAVCSKSVRTRLTRTISARASLTAVRAGLLTGKSCPTMSIIQAIPASGLRFHGRAQQQVLQARLRIPHATSGCGAAVPPLLVSRTTAGPYG
jgi:hypothetical protein